jgi:26S proteasome regulatory subunit N9
LDRVEVIVMKALSKGLVKGTINQIDRAVRFSWVQPRVLDMDQLGKMRDRLGEWLAAVKKGSKLMRDGAPELMAAA